MKTVELPKLGAAPYIYRRFRTDDIDAVFAGLGNPKVTQYYGVHFDSLEATQEQMDWFAALESERKGQWFALETAEGAFVGAGGYNDWDHAHHKAEIGFWLLPEYWGKGIMKLAFPALLEYGFNVMNLHRIEGYVDAGNTKCKRALQKTALRYEGTMLDCEQKDGAWVSVDIYATVNR